jgi:hypothetical protein
VGEAVQVPGAEDETAAQLKGIPSEFVLRVAGGFGAGPGFGVVSSEQVEQVRAFELHDGIGFTFFVNEQREGDACFLAKSAGVSAIAKSNGGQPGTAIVEGLFVGAQLRDMLAAKNSTVVAQENHHCRLADPE